jgi:hypothetical protein
MIVPRPFSQGVVVFASPISISPTEDGENARVRIQEALHGITEQADTYWDSK